MGIRFNQPVVLEGHIDCLREVLLNAHLSAGGAFTASCESELNKINGCENLLVTSATHALEMIALLLDVAPGDEIIVPSFTFVSTANAFALRGATLRFADNDASGNILLSEVSRLINARTKAVVAVDYAGNSADLFALSQLCTSAGVVLVEDAAQAIRGSCHGKPLGSFGHLGCYSFHETKNVGAGEGGALIVQDSAFLERAYVLRDKGTDQRRFLRGQVDKYTWVDLGSSYGPSELNAAYLAPQLKSIEMIGARRQAIWQRYFTELSSSMARAGARVLETPAHNRPNHHIFGLVFESRRQRDSFIDHAAQSDILCRFHYVPLHSSPFGLRYTAGMQERLPGCDRLSSCLARLPLFYNLPDADVERVIECARSWIGKQ